MVMAVTRTNILEDVSARDRYIEGVFRLKREIINPQQQLSTYDAFVIWHHRTMNLFTPPTQRSRNAAHGGPVFLPWHRYMLITLEQQLQRVLNDVNFALPYWAWHRDGDRPVAQQRNSPVFAANCMGGSGVASQQFQVTTGPFAFQPANPQTWRVRVAGTSSGSLGLVNRGLQRQLAGDAPTLPTSAQARNAVALPTYDEPPWDMAPAGSFRNVCEGWQPNGPALHNRVHVWIGRDMGLSSSPNDPLFYLNHANVDRMWAAWQRRNPASQYRPAASAPASLAGHRFGDRLNSIYPSPPAIRDMIDVSAVYSYNTVADLL